MSDIIPITNTIHLLEIEAGNRLDDDAWGQDIVYTNLWYLSHTPPGKPSRVEENGVELTEQATAEDVQDNPGSWIWGADAALDTRENVGTYEFGITEQYAYGGKNAEKYWNHFSPEDDWLLVHTSGSDDPGGGGYIVLSFFWERFINKQFAEPLVFESNYYLPYLYDDGISNIVLETSSYYEGGTRQTFGTIRLINTDGYFDERLSDYIYEAKKLIWKVGENGDVYADFVTAWRGWTGDVLWKDEEIEIEIEDMRKHT